MNILEEIFFKTKHLVQQQQYYFPQQNWKTLPFYNRKCLSLKQQLLNDKSTGIIAEYKKASPSKGIINDLVNCNNVVTGYQKYGAAAISILTEQLYFKGNTNDINLNRNVINIPILRKDFIFCEYQIEEAKAIGADVILLIAAYLTAKEVKRLATFAINIGLEVLLELHDENELDHICDATDIIGINNRNLKNFEVDIERSLRMAKKIGVNKIKVAESGISNIENIFLFKQHGFKGFLIGENFMKQKNPVNAFEKFVKKLKQ